MAGEKILAGGSKKYTYIGPYYKKGHILNNKLYNPERMSDKEIEEFMDANEFARKWWKEVEMKNEK
jgi:hypothetical protein